MRGCRLSRPGGSRRRKRFLVYEVELIRYQPVSKDEIIAELPRLSQAELDEVQTKLDELAGRAWRDGAELSDADKQALDATLVEYEKSPDAGSAWDEVEARILNKLG